MANTDWNTLLSGAVAINRSGFLTALEKRAPYVVTAGENPASLTPGNVNVIVYGGVLFNYDSTDALTSHDGTTCIVTADGKRFKTDQFKGFNNALRNVADKDLSTPPGSPSLGDRYIVAVSGTGAWATHDKQIAEYTARGWVFQVPNAYDLAMVVDEAQYYHYSAGGAWTSGIPAITIADASISLKKLKYFPLGVAAENQTTNTPPGSPADGDAYIVGGVPTGAWVGHTLDLAIWETSAWIFYTPYEGATLYDRALNAAITFNGTTWVSSVSGYSQITHAETAAVENSANLTNKVFSATAAPTTADSNHADTVTLSHTAKAAGKILEIEYQCEIRMNGTKAGADSFNPDYYVFCLQVDSTAAMADWHIRPADTTLVTGTGSGRYAGLQIKFTLAAADAAAHTYRIRIMKSSNVASGSPTVDIDIARRSFFIRELA